MDIQHSSGTYQCSPRDLGHTIELKIIPFEEGFNGTCQVKYGPIMMDCETETNLKKYQERDYFETYCRGRSLTSTKKYARLKVDTYELQLFDAHNGLADTFRIQPQLHCAPAKEDSCAQRIWQVNGQEIALRCETQKDRDILMLFIQNQRKQQGADMSLYEMDHRKADNYRSSQHDFQTNEHKNFGEISHIGVEQELQDELNSYDKGRQSHVAPCNLNQSQFSPQNHNKLRGSHHNKIGNHNNTSLQHSQHLQHSHPPRASPPKLKNSVYNEDHDHRKIFDAQQKQPMYHSQMHNNQSNFL